MLRLSRRLEMIAEMVPPGSKLADIGSDHALLPTYLARQGRITKAVAGEVNAGPYEAAAKQVKDAQLGSPIDVRLGDGLAVISPHEVDVITIAGMGGALITSILEAGTDKLAGVTRLVLQPNVGEYNVRSWLLAHGWVLVDERILEEDSKIYEILCAAPPDRADITNDQLYAARVLSDTVTVDREELLKFGPHLLQEPSDVWFMKWQHELDKLEKIRARLSLSQAEESRRKEQELEREIRTIREVMACLQKDKASSN
ncbi:tRNA (adenine(22)-N(1))-methyltransferase [Paenibacillus xerothermodurans]|uniref:tRNA (Adenine-N(1))-methyltransferase n=1 Tax=Paenibacillus xerothermodurans TaxID=1977292 RepID=A0A2W1NWH4_PAEXE|nr:tRNA (adenine(22)-N(1))-methyltransferase TrmK [Paenibacillus xerothermodurans]PZE22903.1 tRNA (adenine-N(1))-methyltransferase [Paenibacillus xerothermodurans]